MHGSLQTRAWLLMLIDAAEQAGIAPISKELLHRLVFLSSCLAPVYGIDTPPSKQIIKYEQGPFYPDKQWDIDRIVFMGLLKISDIKYPKGRKKKYWLSANYKLTDAGIDVVKKLETLSDIKIEHNYLIDLVMAYASLQEKAKKDLALKDVTYDNPGKAEWALIDFSDIDKNYSYKTATYFSRDKNLNYTRSLEEQIHHYLNYLEYRATSTEVVI